MERLEFFATRVKAGDLEEMNVNVRWQVESMRSDKKDWSIVALHDQINYSISG